MRAFIVLVELSVWLCFAWPTSARACTTFSVDTPAGPLVAKSFDWSTGEGWVVFNERGRERTLLFPAPGVGPWQARYASLSLTTVGPGLPVSGMNEAGLVIESLVDLGESAMESATPGVPTALEFVQMGLDTAASVRELATLATQTRFAQLGVALHFFACDRSGACAVLESRAGKLKITMGDELETKALANRPYAEDLAALAPSWLPRWLTQRKASSPERFAIAAAAAHSAPEHATELFAELDRLKMPSRTQWQLVWELAQGKVHVRFPRLGTRVSMLSVRDVPRCRAVVQVVSIADPSGMMRSWSSADTARSRVLISRQLGDGAAPHWLATQIVGHTQSTRCASAR